MEYTIHVRYKSNFVHKQRYADIADLVADLILRLKDHEEYGNAVSWTIYPA